MRYYGNFDELDKNFERYSRVVTRSFYSAGVEDGAKHATEVLQRILRGDDSDLKELQSSSIWMTVRHILLKEFRYKRKCRERARINLKLTRESQ